MKIIDRYIMKQIFVALAVVMFVLLGIAWLAQIIKLIELFFAHNIPFSIFIKFSSFLLPKLTSVILPIAFLIALIFILTKLISDRELIVMKSVGMGAKALYKPIFYVSLILFFFNLFLTTMANPWADVAFKKYKNTFLTDLSQVALKEKAFNSLTSGLMVYVDHTKGNVLYDIFINDSRKAGYSRTIYAEKGKIQRTTKGYSIVLVNGSLHEGKGIENANFGKFENYTIDLGLAQEKALSFQRPKEISTIKLLHPERLSFVDAKNVSKYKVELYKRFVEPFYNVIFALICALFLLKSSFSRQGNFKPIISSVIVAIFVYSSYIAIFSFIAKQPQLAWTSFAITWFFIHTLYLLVVKEGKKVKNI